MVAMPAQSIASARTPAVKVEDRLINGQLLFQSDHDPLDDDNGDESEFRGGLDWFRTVDIALSMAALVVLAPLLLAVAIAVKLTSEGPAIFRHRRIGRNGQEFYCFKFRTMVCDADKRLAALLRENPAARAEWERDHKLRNDPRITPIGVFLRKTSLDELPQIFNVLLGTMSWVGPRPIVAGEIIRYGRRFNAYCKVRPGITGLWQISGRNDTSYRRRVAMDVLYVRTRTLRLYSRIILLTVPAVLRQHGSY
ncbi:MULTISPECIES: sugar transferase [Novosphingobium]|uniref:Exopolysaccharide production protein ExoY n=1 Tax=Novosphingobium sediminicola TaxID=563162 RepID=A0A7W6CFB7_9SPHN|nr:sugar transferase [Novosphingobium sediminicola]MBB3955499.1 exopolysaccharide production protein ExoY [Novosphingobium sediminicola]NOW46273.1 exopolysaccharide production protein ExoY [Novosphingobium sp. SG751A]